MVSGIEGVSERIWEGGCGREGVGGVWRGNDDREGALTAFTAESVDVLHRSC